MHLIIILVCVTVALQVVLRVAVACYCCRFRKGNSVGVPAVDALLTGEISDV